MNTTRCYIFMHVAENNEGEGREPEAPRLTGRGRVWQGEA